MESQSGVHNGQTKRDNSRVRSSPQSAAVKKQMVSAMRPELRIGDPSGLQFTHHPMESNGTCTLNEKGFELLLLQYSDGDVIVIREFQPSICL